MHLFYTPDIAETLTLPEVESGHCVRVLRLSEGDEIGLIDGRGTFYRAEITLAHNKRCGVRIIEERKSRRRSVTTTPLNSHTFKYMRDRISDRRGGSEREVNDTERYTKPT